MKRLKNCSRQVNSALASRGVAIQGSNSETGVGEVYAVIKTRTGKGSQDDVRRAAAKLPDDQVIANLSVSPWITIVDQRLIVQ